MSKAVGILNFTSFERGYTMAGNTEKTLPVEMQADTETVKQAVKQAVKPLGRKTKIIVRRTFGNQNLLELYSDYVASMISQRIAEEKHSRRKP